MNGRIANPRGSYRTSRWRVYPRDGQGPKMWFDDLLAPRAGCHGKWSGRPVLAECRLDPLYLTLCHRRPANATIPEGEATPGRLASLPATRDSPVEEGDWNKFIHPHPKSSSVVLTSEALSSRQSVVGPPCWSSATFLNIPPQGKSRI